METENEKRDAIGFHAPKCDEVHRVDPPTTPTYQYWRCADPAGAFPDGRRREYAMAALDGREADDTKTFAKGTRAGCKQGFAVERVGDEMQAVKYGPTGGDPHPHGEKRTVFFRAEVA